jgi:hypothetical protein
VLELEFAEPHWWDGVDPPGVQPYAALIRSAEQPVRVEGAGELIPWDAFRAEGSDVAAMKRNGFVLRVTRGAVRIHF